MPRAGVPTASVEPENGSGELATIYAVLDGLQLLDPLPHILRHEDQTTQTSRLAQVRRHLGKLVIGNRNARGGFRRLTCLRGVRGLDISAEA